MFGNFFPDSGFVTFELLFENKFVLFFIFCYFFFLRENFSSLHLNNSGSFLWALLHKLHKTLDKRKKKETKKHNSFPTDLDRFTRCAGTCVGRWQYEGVCLFNVPVELDPKRDWLMFGGALLFGFGESESRRQDEVGGREREIVEMLVGWGGWCQWQGRRAFCVRKTCSETPLSGKMRLKVLETLPFLSFLCGKLSFFKFIWNLNCAVSVVG
jgi:hypothetical protein